MMTMMTRLMNCEEGRGICEKGTTKAKWAKRARHFVLGENVGSDVGEKNVCCRPSRSTVNHWSDTRPPLLDWVLADLSILSAYVWYS